MASSSNSTPSHFGYLHKKGEVGIKTYKKRWFILINNDILYFKEEKDYRAHLREPLGKIPLVVATCSEVNKLKSSIVANVDDPATSNPKNNHAHFRIDVPGRTYQLFADTVPEAEAWIRVIKQSKDFFSPLNAALNSSTNPVQTSKSAESVIERTNEEPMTQYQAQETTNVDEIVQNTNPSPPNRNPLSPIALPGMGGADIPSALISPRGDERPKTQRPTRNGPGFTSPVRKIENYKTLPHIRGTVSESQQQLQQQIQQHQQQQERPLSPSKLVRPTSPTKGIMKKQNTFTTITRSQALTVSGGEVPLGMAPMDINGLTALVSSLQQEIIQMRPKVSRISELEERVRFLEKDLEAKERNIFKLETALNTIGGFAPIMLEKSATRHRSASLASLQRDPKTKSFSTDLTPLKKIDSKLKADINRFQLEGYARCYFQAAQKKFTFRRKKVDMKVLLSFSKEEFSIPLLRLGPDLVPQAVLVFRALLSYMGDAGAANVVDSVQPIQLIVEKGLFFPELRDEIFCQLCKQTCNNPSTESYYRGWDVFVVVVVHFGPTKNLEPWLLNYLAEHLKIPGKDTKYAQYCIEKINRMGNRVPNKRVPTIQEIEREKEYPFKPSVFGSSMTTLMELQKETHPYLTVPLLFYSLLETILKNGGLSTEGIFRVNADFTELYKLRHHYDCGNYTVDFEVDPHVPANILKMWLRDLPEPLIPFELYKVCIDRAASCVNDPSIMADIIAHLPDINREIIIHLVAFVQKLAAPENQPATKMGLSNLAILFAPGLIRPRDINLDSLQNSNNEITFMLEMFKIPYSNYIRNPIPYFLQ